MSKTGHQLGSDIASNADYEEDLGQSKPARSALDREIGDSKPWHTRKASEFDTELDGVDLIEDFDDSDGFTSDDIWDDLSGKRAGRALSPLTRRRRRLDKRQRPAANLKLCTYREVSVALLSCAPIAGKLIDAISFFPREMDKHLAMQLSDMFGHYLRLLDITSATDEEHDVLLAIRHAFRKRSVSPFRKMITMLVHLPCQFQNDLRLGNCREDDLVVAINRMADGDYLARKVNQTWLEYFRNSSIQDFLFNGGPAIRLRLDLEQLCLPRKIDGHGLYLGIRRMLHFSDPAEISQLRHLADDLDKVSPTSIQIAFERKHVSLLSKFQLMIEHRTNAPWIWWPLTEPTSALETGQCQLNWTCHCDTKRTATIPRWFAIELFAMLYHHEATPRLHTHAINFYAMSNRFQAPIYNVHGTDSGRGLIDAPMALPPDLERGERLVPIPTPSKSIQEASLTDQSIATTTSGTLVGADNAANVDMQYFVFLSTKVGYEYCLSQIAVTNIGDGGFFNAIRREYLGKKGWLRRLFSIWRFGYCDFSMFEKIADGEYTARQECSPVPPDDHKDYEFKPRPADTIPPISQHEFWRRFYLRRRGTRWRASKSKMCCTTAHALQKIPKRNNKIIEDSDDRDIFWGLLAIDKISFLLVLSYLALLLVGAIGFWVYWLTGHPDDLQNASVPFFASVGCLSLIWILAIQR